MSLPACSNALTEVNVDAVPPPRVEQLPNSTRNGDVLISVGQQVGQLVADLSVGGFADLLLDALLPEDVTELCRLLISRLRDDD